MMHMGHACDDDNIDVPLGFQGRGLFTLMTDTAQFQSKCEPQTEESNK